MKRIILLIVLGGLLAACSKPTGPVAPTPDAGASTLEASNYTAVQGDEVILKVQLKDEAGEAIAAAGHSVAFYASSASLSTLAQGATGASRVVAPSGKDGSVSVKLSSSAAGSITVDAYLGPDDGGSLIGTVTVTFTDDGKGGKDPHEEEPTPTASTSTISTASAKATVDTDVVVQVQVHDANGEAYLQAGQSVTFVTDAGVLTAGVGPAAPPTSVTVATDSSGIASVNVFSGTPGTVTVTAHLGEDSQAPVIGSITIDYATLVLDDLTVTYDGEPHALIATFSDEEAAVDATYVYVDAATEAELPGAPRDAGTYLVTVTPGAGYPGSASAILTIQPRPLSFTAAVTFADKAYDGSSAAVATASLDTAGVVPGDDVELAEAMVGEFQVLEDGIWRASAVAGAYANDASSRVIGKLALVGEDAGNYSIEQPLGAATISPRAISFGADLTVSDKPYDGTTVASVVGTLEPLEGDDLSFVGNFVQKDADTDIEVIVELVGDDAANYDLNHPELRADISQRDLVITPDDLDKVYGETLLLDDPTFTVTGLVDGESVASIEVTSSGAAAAANAGSFALEAQNASAGADTLIDNYAITYRAGTLSVLPKELAITPHAGQSKTYGDEDPAITFETSGLVNEDVLSGSLARVAGENVGTYAYTSGDVNVDDGNEGDNYELVIVGENSFEITARELVVTPDDGQSKTYGDDDPVLSYAVTEGSILDGDALTGALSREAGETVGSYAFDLSGLTVEDGNDGANYSLFLGASEPFTIDVRTLTVDGAFTVAERPYDGGVAATIETDELVLVNVVAGDDVVLEPVVEFTDRHVAADKAVTLTAETAISGADVANYSLDLSGAPASTGTIVKADITFDITNKDALTYNGLPLPLITVTDPAPAPSVERVAYTVEYRRVATPSGVEIDEGVSAIREAGQYLVKVTSNDPRYDGQDEIVVTVSTRAITLTHPEAGKVYGEADTELDPILVSGSLGTGQELSGFLSYEGDDAGRYPLTLGSTAVLRSSDDEDVSANYAITVTGDFTIEPAPVSFDIGNADRIVDGVHFFLGDGNMPIGLEVLSTPSSMTDYRLSYRRTHDELYQAIPSAQQPIPTIQDLGTYQVLIESLNPNFAGSSSRTVWLVDEVVFTTPNPDDEGRALPVEADVGATTRVTLPIRNLDGSPRALGPVGLTLDLASNPDTGLTFLDPVTGEPVTSITLPPGADALIFDVLTTTFRASPFEVTVSSSAWTDSPATIASFEVQPQAQLVTLQSAFELGAEATSAPLTVQLQDAYGLPLIAPADILLDLVGDDGLEFLTSGGDALTGVTIPMGSSSTTFHVRAASVGEYAFNLVNASPVAGIGASSDSVVTINAKPGVSVLSPAAIELLATTEIVITGSDFADGAAVSFSDPGLEVLSVVRDSSGQLTVMVRAGADVSAGDHAVTVTNPDLGTATLAAGFSAVKPSLVAGDDGPFGLVEGGSTQLSISELLANDSSSSTLATWGFDDVTATSNVAVSRSGDTLTVNSTGLMADGASLSYRIVDQFGTTATAAVSFSVTLPPVEAIVFDDELEFEAFVNSSYEPPTFQEVFDSWPRASNGSYYADPAAAEGSAKSWRYEAGTDRIVQPVNTSTHEVIVSPSSEALEYYTFEATLSSSAADDDSIGLVIAFVRDGGVNKYLVAHRTGGGNYPNQGWGISYFSNGSQTVLSNVATVGSGGNWLGRSSRVRIVRNGDIIRSWATPFGDLENYLGEMVIDLDANTVNGNHVGVDLSVFKGERQYGYYTYSQAESTYLDIVMEGGVARDVAILLTDGFDSDASGDADTWTGSQVWRFAEGVWQQDLTATIQSELGFPRQVTSVAPYPAPDGEPSNTRFYVHPTEVKQL